MILKTYSNKNLMSALSKQKRQHGFNSEIDAFEENGSNKENPD